MKHLRKILPAALIAAAVIIVICIVSISSNKANHAEPEVPPVTVAAPDASAVDATNSVDPAPEKVSVASQSDDTEPTKDEKTEVDKDTKADFKQETKQDTEKDTENSNSSSTSVIAVGIVEEDVNLRKKANTDSDVLATLSGGTAVSILAKKGNWYQVRYGGKKGYMSADFVTSKTSASGLNGYAKVTTDVLNMRDEPNADGDVVAMVSQGEYVKLKGFENGWYKIDYSDYSGYMSGDYLSPIIEKPEEPKPEAAPANDSSSTGTDKKPSSNTDSKPSAPATPSGGESAGNGSGSGSDIVDYALSFRGVTYAYGGASPSGFDCSGFTMYIYDHFGYNLPHGATSQMDYGSAVSMSELSPGDLVFFFDSDFADSGASHVGIYIGGGQIVHATSGPGYCVKVSSFTGDSSTGNYYSDVFLTARHIAN